jgi:hypothetical protein
MTRDVHRDACIGWRGLKEPSQSRQSFPFFARTIAQVLKDLGIETRGQGEKGRGSVTPLGGMTRPIVHAARTPEARAICSVATLWIEHLGHKSKEDGTAARRALTMSAYTISVYDENDMTVAEIPAVASNADAAMDAAKPWVDWVVSRTQERPLWYSAVERPRRADKFAASARTPLTGASHGALGP